MIYVICGPTCSGKTEIAKNLATFLNSPIINADAFQIYKEMNIGTAKISKDDPFYERHQLIDIISPEENFSVKEYQQLFRQIVEQNKDKDIIVSGGTGLYIRASLYDYVFFDEEPTNDDEYAKYNNDELYDLLAKLDSDAATKIHPNNRKRVIRALNIASHQQINKSENIANQKHEIIYPNVRILMISPNREALYENINHRVDVMFDNGLVEEVKYLLNKYNLSTTAKAAIGYKEVIDYLNGSLSLQSCKDLIKQRTRNYAKRQVTFFKNQFTCEIFDNAEDLIKAVKDNG